MPVGKGSVAGSPYVGVYLKVSEKFAFAPPTVGHSEVSSLERTLGVKVLRTFVGDMAITGSLIAMNSNGIVVTSEMNESERAILSEAAPVTSFRSRLNAFGNNILANDNGALVHPEFSHNDVEKITAALGVKVVQSTIAGEGTVAMTAVATNKGALVHPGATHNEIKVLEEVLKVPVHKTTANFGVPLVGACVVANTRGLFAGGPTTPVELVHIEEGLSVYD